MTPSTPEPDDTLCAGTFLDWMGSQDAWFVFTPDSDSLASFSLCDSASYDTSLVLYAGDCDTQVACNGDGQGDSDCQQYYSLIEYPVLDGTTYYIRMGGWQGSTGAGSVNVTFIGDNETGACCTDSVCNEALTTAECNALSGNWFNGEACSDVDCTEDPCSNTSIVQEPHGPADIWFAGTSANDPKNNMVISRAELVMLDSVNKLTVSKLDCCQFVLLLSLKAK